MVFSDVTMSMMYYEASESVVHYGLDDPVMFCVFGLKADVVAGGCIYFKIYSVNLGKILLIKHGCSYHI